MEHSPFTFEEGLHAMQSAAAKHADAIAGHPGDICLFGHNHLQFLGKAAGKLLLNPGSCGLPLDYDTRAPYAILHDGGNEPRIELRRVEYDRNETIGAIRAFSGFPHAGFWGKLHIAALQSGSDIQTSRFWGHARKVGGGKFPMENGAWREAVETFGLTAT